MTDATPEELPESLTGVPAVDAALARLEGLEERPVEEHPEVFEAVHGALRGALGGAGS
ncbi:hypothetical protein [Nocardioides bigeumensis]|jgi:hypothetical protein|uniref:FXSXX-COOH protein n=1 Tax=Nocardioides bigeumensis TaxID=433657 RepID=A0ABN2Y2Y6_9ACTN